MATQTYYPFADIPVTKQDIDRCRYSNWYKKFIKYAPNSIIFENVPLEFIEYLKQDGFHLPENSDQSFYDMKIVNDASNNDYSDWEDVDEDADSNIAHLGKGNCNEMSGNDKKLPINPLVDFPDFHKKVKQTIKEYHNIGLTPKLNWSAPRDSAWILPYNNTMMIKEINDLYLLLNASNYIMHDLECPYEGCGDDHDDSNSANDLKSNTYELVLREWVNINPALEFRVFIYHGEVIGVSQRDMKTSYDYLPALVPELKDRIDDFVYDIFLAQFCDSHEKMDAKNFEKNNAHSEISIVVDVYIPRPYDKVWLIDCNPFGRCTDALLFSWNELVSIHAKSIHSKPNDKDYELRLVDNTSVGHRDHTENQMPIDIVQASLNPESLKELTLQWQQALTLQKEQDEHEN
ncbi:hypothetical protein ACO0RG_004262 [Hanseniaspora osmophila]